jgi:signal-transduction protein with cAMP-binding, CBS, and nucleotidyltransferase domain
MLKYEELKAKDLVREAIALEPSKTLYDARNILLRYNISRVVIAKDDKPLGISHLSDISPTIRCSLFYLAFKILEHIGYTFMDM